MLRSRTCRARAPPAVWAAVWSHSPAGELSPGIELVIKAVDLESRLKNADLCLTGEGAIDGQSAFGKTAVGVARLAHSLGCPVLALAGSIGAGRRAVLDHGIDAYFSICPGPIELRDAIEQAAELLERATEQAVRGFLAGRSGQNRSLTKESRNDCVRADERIRLIDWIRQRERTRSESKPLDQAGHRRRLRDPGCRRPLEPAGHDRHADGRPPLPARSRTGPSESATRPWR